MSTGIKFGVIGALIIMIEALIFHFAGLQYNQYVNWISNLILVVVIVLSIYFYKKNDLGGYLPFSQGLKNGMQTALVMGVLGSIWALIYINLINPDFMNHMKEIQIAEMEKNGMTDEQIEQGMKIAGYFMSPLVMFIMGIVSYAFIGFMVSLISTLIMKKDKPEHLDATTPQV